MNEREPMYAIPPAVAGETGQLHVSGVTCPGCAGVLRVATEGNDGALWFVCRVGHTFAVSDLLAADEEKLEDLLWAATTAFAEMVALLRDLETYAEAHGRRDIGGPHVHRLRRAEDHVRRLRAILEENHPVDLAVGAQATEEETSPEVAERATRVRRT